MGAEVLDIAMLIGRDLKSCPWVLDLVRSTVQSDNKHTL